MEVLGKEEKEGFLKGKGNKYKITDNSFLYNIGRNCINEHHFVLRHSPYSCTNMLKPCKAQKYPFVLMLYCSNCIRPHNVLMCYHVELCFSFGNQIYHICGWTKDILSGTKKLSKQCFNPIRWAFWSQFLKVLLQINKTDIFDSKINVISFGSQRPKAFM